MDRNTYNNFQHSTDNPSIQETRAVWFSSRIAEYIQVGGTSYTFHMGYRPGGNSIILIITIFIDFSSIFYPWKINMSSFFCMHAQECVLAVECNVKCSSCLYYIFEDSTYEKEDYELTILGSMLVQQLIRKIKANTASFKKIWPRNWNWVYGKTCGGVFAVFLQRRKNC